VILVLCIFLGHWWSSVFFQSFFLHRYAAHRMFTMSKGWERFFYLCTFVFQGSSFLLPRGYAILHREHHAFADTERDPHSPHFYRSWWSMMVQTARRYHGINTGTVQPEPRFEGEYPRWPLLEWLGDRWLTRVVFGAAFAVVYILVAPHWAYWLLLPIHWVMGPTHGLIVNWFGHKNGYRNFETRDESKNSLPFDFVTVGELFQNNHHKHSNRPNFAWRRWELDPTWQVMRVLSWLGIIQLRQQERPAGDAPAAAPVRA
jgi:stearoyl-CoA desaturase (delta-9 desaturase)